MRLQKGTAAPAFGQLVGHCSSYWRSAGISPRKNFNLSLVVSLFDVNSAIRFSDPWLIKSQFVILRCLLSILDELAGFADNALIYNIISSLHYCRVMLQGQECGPYEAVG
jgi:hypothetical protein